MSYIIIKGPAGVGKSELKENLIKWFRNKKIKVKAFSPGIFRKKYNLSFSIKDKIKSDNYFIPKAKKLIEMGYVVIFDEVYYYPQQITNFNKKLGRPIILSLKASLKKCLERNKKRGNKKLPEKNIREVYRLDKSFKRGFIINTENKSDKKVLEQAIKIIKTNL